MQIFAAGERGGSPRGEGAEIPEHEENQEKHQQSQRQAQGFSLATYNTPDFNFFRVSSTPGWEKAPKISVSIRWKDQGLFLSGTLFGFGDSQVLCLARSIPCRSASFSTTVPLCSMILPSTIERARMTSTIRLLVKKQRKPSQWSGAPRLACPGSNEVRHQRKG